VLRVGQTTRIAETRILHAQSLRLAIHHLGEVFLVTGNCFGERDTGVVPRLDDHSLEQVLDLHLRADLDEHLRTARLPGLLRYRHGLIELERTLLERGETQIGRHQLGQGGRFEALVGRLCSQFLPGSGLDQQPRPGGQCRRRGELLGRGRAAAERLRIKEKKQGAKLGHGWISGTKPRL
jgi:hypothetical protein